MNKIQQQQIAPDFTAITIDGIHFNLADFRGKKILLNFHRNVGCPVCNLRFHSLQQQADTFKEHQLEVIDIYESSPEQMRTYLEGMQVKSLMVPNPDLKLYELYKVERSFLKVFRGIFHGALAKMRKGKALAEKKIQQDGNMNRIGAEFLIDEKGKVVLAHYGAYLGDHIPLERIRQFIGLR